jgi:hypothetical protein
MRLGSGRRLPDSTKRPTNLVEGSRHAADEKAFKAAVVVFNLASSCPRAAIAWVTSKSKGVSYVAHIVRPSMSGVGSTIVCTTLLNASRPLAWKL